MTRAEREANPEESFDGGYHLYAKEKHKERVAKILIELLMQSSSLN